MDITKKLASHLEEAEIHIARLNDVLESLKQLYPLNSKSYKLLSSAQKDKLDVLAFRFAKLQDLLGTKIFREYLMLLQFPVEDKNFLELLKELDKEKLIDIDFWSELRGVRNSISHDYPSEEEEKIEAINYLIEHIVKLMDITNNIRTHFEA